ncbi:glycoside hydrolase family 9 protein [Microbacterium sp. 2P06AB]|uniref:glycoside hydrolase family 9 protein n=1 Tax=Microbacterium sp. 2P06AB TaxID=3132291 RepID=UPI0039A51061
MSRTTAAITAGILAGAAMTAVPVSATAAPAELVRNGDFSTGHEPWWSAGVDGFDTATGAFCAGVPGSENPWDVLVGQSDIALADGVTYTLTARVRADAPATVVTQVAPTVPDAAYTTYLSQSTPLTDDWQQVNGEFTARDLGQGTVSELQFRLGGNTSTRFCVDDVSLVAQDGSTPPTIPVGDDELLPNPTLDESTTPWWTSGPVSLSNPTQRMCATVTEQTPDLWDVLLGHNDIFLPGDTGFRLSFTASASTAATVSAKVGTYTGASPSDWIEQSFTLGTEPRSYDATFTTTPADDYHLGQVQFRLGAVAAGTEICFDKVSLRGTAYSYTADPGPAVKVNQVGYLPRGPKRATVVSDASTPLSWTLEGPDGSALAAGETRPAGFDPSAGASVHTIDFSDVTAEAADVRLRVGADVSHPFTISSDVFQSLRVDSMRFFYTNRSGIEIDGDIAGAEYARPAGHVGTSPSQGDENVGCLEPQPWSDGWTCTDRHDVQGGWYDAGDHGKYVVNGGIAVAQVMSAYERAVAAGTADALGDSTLAVPERDNGVPDILDEARWQMEFLLRMQVPSGDPLAGMAWHKVHDRAWTGLPLMPHEDPQERLLHRPSTAATLNLAATAAQASRLFEPFDASFAARLLTAAERAYDAALEHPDLLAPAEDGTGGGTYDDDDVTDEFYWAAAELYITTGGDRYRTDVEASPLHQADVFEPGGFYWGDVAALGRMQLARLATDLPDIDRIRASVVDAAERLIADQRAQPFGQPYAPNEGLYDWGSNSSVLNNQVVLGTAFDLTQRPRYADAVVEGFDYLLGRNVLGQSYITGYGTNDARNQHSRWYANALDPALPHPPVGTVAGGPNSSIQDPVAGAWLQGCAPQACYVDNIGAWSVNEITVNWNSALTWVSSFVADLGDGFVAVSPRAVDDVASGPAGTAIPVRPLANDVAGDADVPLTATTLTLLDTDDAPATSMVVSGQGRYELDGEVVSFVPEAGFEGSADPVRYRVADTRGTEVSATIRVTVVGDTAVGSPPAPGAAGSNPSTAASGVLARSGMDPAPLWALSGVAAVLTAVGILLLHRRRLG